MSVFRTAGMSGVKPCSRSGRSVLGDVCRADQGGCSPVWVATWGQCSGLSPLNTAEVLLCLHFKRDYFT